jgi:hypothetical protein
MGKIVNIKIEKLLVFSWSDSVIEALLLMILFAMHAKISINANLINYWKVFFLAKNFASNPKINCDSDIQVSV